MASKEVCTSAPASKAFLSAKHPFLRRTLHFSSPEPGRDPIRQCLRRSTCRSDHKQSHAKGARRYRDLSSSKSERLRETSPVEE